MIPHLVVTYRRGRPLAAYYSLARRPGDPVDRTERHEAGLLIDYTADGRAIGIEITAPTGVTLDALNRALAAAHQGPAAADDLAPLIGAGG